MITRFVRIQLIVFTILSLTAGAIIFFQYARVPDLMGVGKIDVTARFSEGAGIYPYANVTYRGVQVGKVKDVRLAPDGVDVDMSIDNSAAVPEDVDANILSVSAIGEQYVDFVPRPGATAAMKDGTRIPLDHTHIPRQIAQVLDDVNGLLTSVPTDSLGVVLNEAQQAFQGLEPDLRSLLSNTDNLVRQADANYGPTSKLLTDAEPVLDSQLSTTPAIRQWTKDLAAFTGRLEQSDGDFRQLLRSVPGAASQVQGFFQDLSSSAPTLLSSSGVLTDLAAAYHKPIEEVLVVYPMVAAAEILGAAPDRGGQFRLAFKTIANYPGGCSEGWPTENQPLGPRGPEDLTDEAFPKTAYCQIPQNDPRVTRGARNLQCFEPGSPPGRRAATIYQCRGDGYSATSPGKDLIPVDNPAAQLGNNVLGLLGGPGTQPPSPKELTWQNLVLGGLTP
ncbi:MCE family protein [Amycolatopsis sp. GM8]|uniref:MCE family protein n=1 Tax=Amycolatopsis sp. GM8 TaxID=2896530 RepID=UPI001F43D1F5|nr:MlaD family protein [Amycolatopsis sp. GM8]